MRREKTIGPNVNAHESADCSILLLRKVQITQSPRASLVSGADYSALGFRNVQSLVPRSESVNKSLRDETQL
jgi:hypothetical protein